MYEIGSKLTIKTPERRRWLLVLYQKQLRVRKLWKQSFWSQYKLACQFSDFRKFFLFISCDNYTDVP